MVQKSPDWRTRLMMMSRQWVKTYYLAHNVEWNYNYSPKRAMQYGSIVWSRSSPIPNWQCARKASSQDLNPICPLSLIRDMRINNTPTNSVKEVYWDHPAFLITWNSKLMINFNLRHVGELARLWFGSTSLKRKNLLFFKNLIMILTPQPFWKRVYCVNAWVDQRKNWSFSFSSSPPLRLSGFH